MLVLSRKRDERVFLTVPGIPEPIIVTVCGFKAGHTRLGFEANPLISVDREEVHTDKLQDRAKGKHQKGGK